MKNHKIKTIITLIFFILFFVSNAQPQKEIDSLLIILKTAKEDTNKVNTLYEICRQYYMLNESEKVLKYAMESKSLCEKIMFKKGLANSLRVIGAAYSNLSDFPNAIDYHLKSLKISEEIGNKTDIASSLTNIGRIYEDLGDYPKAMDYQLRGLKIKEEINDKEKIANSLSNIGNIYARMLNYQKALDYQLRSLKIREEFKDREKIAISIANIGSIYSDMANYPKALEYLFRGLDIFKEVANKYGTASTLGSIGTIYLREKQYVQAMKYSQQAMQLAKDMNDFYLEKDILDNLHEIYKATGNSTEALKCYERFILLKDSIFKEENQKQIMQKQLQFDFDKKQAIANAEQEKINIVHAAKSRQQQLIIILVMSVLILVFIFSYFLYKRFRITKKQKQIIEEKNFVLNQQNEEISSQRDEIESQRDEITAQRDTVTKQKEHIENIHEELTDSIHYAERIQKAVLPSTEYINKISVDCQLSAIDYFILFKPRNIVSGDFYFFGKIKNKLLIAVADCTGHGVPGAFMSMLGISFLNEIISKEHIHSVNQILNELRNYIIHSLQQKGISGEQKDGMDIALISYDSVTNSIQFTGANNSLYIISNNAKELIEIKPDKMPVAIYENMNPFTNNIIQLQKGDIIYLATDGYEDQFGGPAGKKFLSKKLKQLLIENFNKSLPEQKDILENTIEEWKNGYEIKCEQTDDITIMGIKIS